MRGGREDLIAAEQSVGGGLVERAGVAVEVILALEVGERGAGARSERAVDRARVVTAVGQVVLELPHHRRREHELVVGANALDGAGALVDAGAMAPGRMFGSGDRVVHVAARVVAEVMRPRVTVASDEQRERGDEDHDDGLHVTAIVASATPSEIARQFQADCL